MDQTPFPAEVMDLFDRVEADPPALRQLRPQVNNLLGRGKDLSLEEELTRYFLWRHPHMTRDQVMLRQENDISAVAQVIPLIAATTVAYPPALCLTEERPTALPREATNDVRPSIDGYVSVDEDFELSFKGDLPLCFRKADGEHSMIVPISSHGQDAFYARGGRSALRAPDITLTRVGMIYDHFVGNNYCHWLLDWLPRLHLIQRMGIRLSELSFVFPRRLLPFQWQMLTAFEIGSDQIVEVADYGETPKSTVAFRSFVTTSTLRRSYTHALHGGSPWAANFLRSTLAATPSVQSAPLRVIIQRSVTRRLIFSQTTMERLLAAGFASVTLEGLSFADQISLFRRATHVIAAHGAGLANLVFCADTAHVLELFPPGYSTSAYWLISQAIGFDYICAVGETVPIESEVRTKNHNIFCSDEIVSAWLSKAG